MNGKPLTIMVVDDLPANLQLLGDLLREDGYRVLQFPSGPLALRAASRETPDLVLLDILMPGMDGFEVCRALRQIDELDETPILFVSALDDLQRKIEAFRCGGVDYITKPFEKLEVLARVRTHLQLRQARFELRDQNRQLDQMVEERTLALRRVQAQAEIGGFFVDTTDRKIHWLGDAWRLLGLPDGTPIQLPEQLLLVHPDDRDALEAAWDAFWDAGGQHPLSMEFRISSSAGTRWLRAEITAEHREDGSLHLARGFHQDITQRKRQEQARREEQVRLVNALEAAEASTWEWNTVTDTVVLSERWAKQLGYQLGELTPATKECWQERVHPDDLTAASENLQACLEGKAERYDAEYRIRHRRGHWLWLRTTGRAVLRSATGRATLIAGIDIDVTEQHEREAAISAAARRDTATGLANRLGFAEHVSRILSQSGDGTGPSAAVVYIDLDDFAAVNAGYGAEAGDSCIEQITTRLERFIGSRDDIGRVGGDEFALLLRDVQPELLPMQLMRLKQLIGEPLSHEDQRIDLTASLGASLSGSPQSTTDAERLLRQADHAMYQAKLKGKNRHCVFDNAVEDSQRRKFQILEDIARGLRNGEFRLHYQPKIYMPTGALIGFEALIRWQHPERGLLPPADFIPVLGNHTLAVDLQDWVIGEAMDQLLDWDSRGFYTSLSINVDGVNLHDPGFPEKLRGALKRRGSVDPERLELEILETSAMEDMPFVSEQLKQLRDTGFKLSLDDFGTGYSSMTFLKWLPVQVIKIDQSFVRELLETPDNAMIIQSIMGLSRSFRRDVLAEGVESALHGRLVMELGCEMGQGYAIARPMPPEMIPAWRDAWRVPSEWCHCRPLDMLMINGLLAELDFRSRINEGSTRHSTLWTWLSSPEVRERIADKGLESLLSALPTRREHANQDREQLGVLLDNLFELRQETTHG